MSSSTVITIFKLEQKLVPIIHMGLGKGLIVDLD